MAIAPSVARLLTRVEAFRPAAGADPHARARGRLALLLAADDADVLTALGQRSWLWDEVLLDARVHSPDADLGRVERWTDVALRDLLGPAPIHRARPLLEALGQRGAAGLIPRLAVHLRDPLLRRRALRLLADLDLPDAWRLLREHDGPDLDPEIRLGAALRDPARPRPALASFLGAGVDPERRARLACFVLTLPDPLVVADDVLTLLERCVFDGVASAAILAHLSAIADERRRHRLFDLLWPLAREGRCARGCREFDFFRVVVRTAPAPDLVAILLDTLDHSAGIFLVYAIIDRPDPHLLPALGRWSRASESESERRQVDVAISECRGASPWVD